MSHAISGVYFFERYKPWVASEVAQVIEAILKLNVDRRR
jgi:hypothetical protein